VDWICLLQESLQWRVFFSEHIIDNSVLVRLEVKRELGTPSRKSEDNFKVLFGKWDVRIWTGFACSGMYSVSFYFLNTVILLRSIKGGKFVSSLPIVSLSK
jgi:hypothetical protein